MIVGEPRLLMILAVAREYEASRSTGTPQSSASWIPGGQAWQRMPVLAESSRPDAEFAVAVVAHRHAGAGHCMG